MSDKKRVGRPKKITPAVLRKLEVAFSLGLNDKQARLFAGNLPASTFYDYCQEHPEFSELKELLKQSPEINAKTNIAKALKDGDKELSKWYLERKCKDEFSTKQDLGINGEINVPVFIGEDEFENDE